MELNEQLDYIKNLFSRTKKEDDNPESNKEKVIFQYLDVLIKDAKITNHVLYDGPFGEKYKRAEIGNTTLFKIFPNSDGITFNGEEFSLIMKIFSTDYDQTKDIIIKYLIKRLGLKNKNWAFLT